LPASHARVDVRWARRGRTIHTADALVAGTARSHGVAVEPSDPDRTGKPLDHIIRALNTSRPKTAAVDYLEPVVR
jgi:hypothetical protein